jgi:Clr5 domain
MDPPLDIASDPSISPQQASEAPPEVWESKRAEIEQLYIVEDLELEQVIETLAGSGFYAP